MRPIKLNLLLLAFVILIFFNCKKSSRPPVNYNGTFVVTINDSTESFNNSNEASFAGTMLNIQATQKTYSSLINYFFITINAGQAVTTGTYADTISPITQRLVAQIIYENAVTGLTYYAGLSSTSAAVVITSITKTEVQGTFSGVLAIDNEIGAASVKINGWFDLKIQI